MATGSDSLLVTISGGSGAGKSLLASCISKELKDTTVIHSDDHFVSSIYCGGSWRYEAGGLKLDFGIPSAYDVRFLTDITRGALEENRVVVVEGLFARHIWAEDVPRYDVYVDCPADLRLARKILRQVVKGATPLEGLLTNYVARRRFAHEAHVAPLRAMCDVVVDGESDVTELVQYLLARIRMDSQVRVKSDWAVAPPPEPACTSVRAEALRKVATDLILELSDLTAVCVAGFNEEIIADPQMMLFYSSPTGGDRSRQTENLNQDARLHHVGVGVHNLRVLSLPECTLSVDCREHVGHVATRQRIGGMLANSQVIASTSGLVSEALRELRECG